MRIAIDIIGDAATFDVAGVDFRACAPLARPRTGLPRGIRR